MYLFIFLSPYMFRAHRAHHQERQFVSIQPVVAVTLCQWPCRVKVGSDQDGTAVPSWSCAKAVYKPVRHMPLLSVQWINTWWWTDELSETCRVSWQNKFVKLVHLVGFITKKFVTMHGHMNVKKIACTSRACENNTIYGSQLNFH